MIYIDPPYNTGKTFTFSDNFKNKKRKTQNLNIDSQIFHHIFIGEILCFLG